MLKLKGQHVRALIKQSGESVRSFALKNGIAQSTMQAWLLGRRNIKLDQLEELARLLRVDVLSIYDVVPRRERRLSRIEEDVRTIRELFASMTDDQRTKTISVALALLDGTEVE